MKRIFLVTVFMAVLFVGACATAPKVEEKEEKVVVVERKEPREPEDWAKYFTEKGAEALEIRDGKVDFPNAIKYFERAIKAYPTSPTLYYNLGLVYQRMGNDQKAVEYYNKALELDPKYAMPVINRAAIYANRLEYNRAIEVCENFLDRENDKDVVVLSALAGFYLLRGDNINAIQSVRRILVQDQANVDALKNLGMIYFLNRDIGLATMVTTNSYNLRPDDAGIANNRGVLFSDQGDDSLAMLYFGNALNNDSKNVSANFNIGAIAMRYGDAETAYERFSIVLSQDPDNLRARVGLAIALRGLSRFEDAEKQYQKVLSKNPNHAKATFNLGILYYDHMNKQVEAKALFRRFISIADGIDQDHIVHKYLADKVFIRPKED